MDEIRDSQTQQQQELLNTGKETAKGANSLRKKIKNKKKLDKVKNAKKTAQTAKKSAKAIKSAGAAVTKAAGAVMNIISWIIGFLLAFWWLFLIILVLVLLAFIVYYIMFNEKISDGTYTSGSVVISETLDNAATIMFYTKYSSQSYYYTVDDSSELYQITESTVDSDGIEIKDFEGRESSFALNPGLLYILDTYLNQGYVNPDQFLKPVYNTCSTGESTNGYCELIDLTDEDGYLVVESSKYEQDEDTTTFSLVEGETEIGVWSWGLASILHYEKFEEESEVQNYAVRSFEYVDEESREVKTMTITDYNELEDSSELKKYLEENFEEVIDVAINTDIPTSIKQGDEEDNGTIPDDEISYGIDNVTTMFGTITNEFSIDWIYQDVYTNMELIDWKGYLPVIDSVDEELKTRGETTDDTEYRMYVDYNAFVNSYVGDKSYVTSSGGEYYIDGTNIYYGTNIVQEETKIEIEVDKDTAYKTICTGEKSAALIEIAFDFSMTTEEKESYAQEVYDSCIERYESVNSEPTFDTVVTETKEYGFYITTTSGDTIFIEIDKDDVSFELEYIYTLAVLKTGDLYTQSVSYENDEPDMSEVVGLDYLTAYVSTYQSYVSTEGYDDLGYDYICALASNSVVQSKIDANLTSEYTNISKFWSVASLDEYTVEAILKNTFDSVDVTETTDGNNNSTSSALDSTNTETTTTTIKNNIIETYDDYIETATYNQKTTLSNYCAMNTIPIYVGDSLPTSILLEGTTLLHSILMSKEFGYSLEEDSNDISYSSVVDSQSIIYTGINDENNSYASNTDLEEATSTYGTYIKSLSTKFGIDSNLIYAIISSTSGGSSDYGSSCSYGSSGCGLMGVSIELAGRGLTAYNFTEGEDVKFYEEFAAQNLSGDVSSDSAVAETLKTNDEANILYGVMLLNYYMEKYDYNVLLAIQAYTYGESNMNKFLSYYYEITGVTKDYTLDDTITYNWTAYRDFCESATETCFDTEDLSYSADFIETVLLAFGTVDTISIRKQDNTYATFNFSYLKSSSTSSLSEQQIFNDKIISLYIGKGGDDYWSEIWDGLYAGIKDFTDGQYDLSVDKGKDALESYYDAVSPENAWFIESEYIGDEFGSLSVIYTAFGFVEGLPVEAYEDLSDEYWNTKFSSMFKTSGSKAWSSSYDLAKTFNSEVVLPTSNPIVLENFGWTLYGNTFSYSDATTILATQGEDISSMTSGLVESIVTTGDTSTIYILHNDGTGTSGAEEEMDTSDDDDDSELVTEIWSDADGTWADLESFDYTEEELIELFETKFASYKEGSDISGYGEYFYNLCEENDVNPFLVASIMAFESDWMSYSEILDTNNYGGIEANYYLSEETDSRFAVFTTEEIGIQASVELTAYYVHTLKLYLPSEMAETYAEGSDDWVVGVNSIYSQLSGDILEATTTATRATVYKYVAIIYKDIDRVAVEEGDYVEAGDLIGYASASNEFQITFVDDDYESDISVVFTAIQDANALSKQYLSYGGYFGETAVGITLDSVSFGSANIYSYVGQCTWYVWGRVNQVLEIELPGWGNANDWCSGAKASGYDTGMTPSLNAIVVWYSGAYGHVAFVESYTEDGDVTISEGNYNNPCASSSSNCNMVTYAQNNPGELLHKVTLTTEQVKTYNDMSLGCYIYLEEDD